MKKLLLASGVALAASMATVSVQADTLGFSLAAKGYSSSITDNDTDIKSDSSTNVEYSFAFEHPVPIIPNVRVAYADFSFDGKYNSNTTFKSTIDQSFVEGTLYYELLDNIVELDLGLTARMMDASLTGKSFNADYKNDSVSALLYAKIQGNIPVVGLSAGVLAQAGGNGSDTIVDAEIYVQYEFSFGLGLSAGYRMIQQELEYKSKATSTKVDNDTDFEGTYVAVFYHF